MTVEFEQVQQVEIEHQKHFRDRGINGEEQRSFPLVLSPSVPCPQLPSSWESVTTTTTTTPQDDAHPLPTFATSSEAVAWAQSNKDALRKKLSHHGAILFRGFPMDSPAAFSDFVEALGVSPLPYVGKSVQ